MLIDQEQTVTRLYGLANVPTGIWIDEQGKIVRPPEIAFSDDRFESFSHFKSAPYLNAVRDWVAKGQESEFVPSGEELHKWLTPEPPERLEADAEFALAEYLYHAGHGDAAVAHFKAAQRLAPDNWNYKRQAYLFSTNPERDYGTTFAKEVEKLNGKPYYPSPNLAPSKKQNY